jgi:hypothetical protein
MNGSKARTVDGIEIVRHLGGHAVLCMSKESVERTATGECRMGSGWVKDGMRE